MEYLEAQEFLRLSRGHLILDVRSPGEYAKGHIPGAENMPLFDNAERAVIGKLYKQEGREEAIEQGLAFVGPKLHGFVQQAKEMAVNKKCFVHCWRGGMRSQHTAQLLSLAGLEVQVLRGGYKAYRKQVLSDFGHIPNLVVVAGPTGTGKTAILQELEKMGEQILDLEAFAGHRGSAFGGLDLPPQPTTQQFHNNLHQALSDLDLSQRIWAEGEGASIGDVDLPHPLWEHLRKAPTVFINMPKSHRVDIILREYKDLDLSLAKDALIRLETRLGHQNTQNLIAALDRKDLKTMVSGLLDYYDKTYLHGHRKHKVRPSTPLEFPDGNAEENAKILLNFVNQNKIEINS